MIVENIGGGGSSLGAAAVARARQDPWRQAVLRTRRCWLAEPADWGNVQIARGVARAHASALSGRGAGDGGPDQRASRHGRGGSNKPVAGISPVRKAAGSRRDEPLKSG